MKLTLILFFTLVVISSYGQNFSNIKPATTETYGYVQENPLIINRGSQGKSYDYFMRFVDQLTTEDGQSLEFISHFTVRDKDSKQPNPLLRDYQRGLLKKSRYGVYGMIERYQFLTATTKDTVTLYVDLASRGPLRVPMKLKLRTTP